MSADPAEHDVVDALLRVHGRTFSDEVGIDLDADDADGIFCLVVTAVLFATRIDHRLAAAAAQALFAEGWTDPQTLADAGWEARTKVLNDAGYARYDESTSRMLGDTCEIALHRYDGDLRRLRDEAEGDSGRLSRALQQFKGIGEVGAGIFIREVQAVWTEFEPYVDDRAQRSAADLGLPRDPDALADLADGDVALLTAALVRAGLEHDTEHVLAVARGEEPPPVDTGQMTSDELYERAQELDVSGRSSMNKDELAAAVREAQSQDEEAGEAQGAREGS